MYFVEALKLWYQLKVIYQWLAASECSKHRYLNVRIMSGYTNTLPSNVMSWPVKLPATCNIIHTSIHSSLAYLHNSRGIDRELLQVRPRVHQKNITNSYAQRTAQLSLWCRTTFTEYCKYFFQNNNNIADIVSDQSSHLPPSITVTKFDLSLYTFLLKRKCDHC